MFEMKDFLSWLAGTLLGIIIGIFIALWLADDAARTIREHHERRVREDEDDM